MLFHYVKSECYSDTQNLNEEKVKTYYIMPVARTIILIEMEY